MEENRKQKILKKQVKNLTFSAENQNLRNRNSNEDFEKRLKINNFQIKNLMKSKNRVYPFFAVEPQGNYFYDIKMRENFHFSRRFSKKIHFNETNINFFENNKKENIIMTDFDSDSYSPDTPILDIYPSTIDALLVESFKSIPHDCFKRKCSESYCHRLKKKNMKRKEEKICYNCETQHTSLWRKLNKKTICNACCLYNKTYNKMRPKNYKAEKEVKRRRRF